MATELKSDAWYRYVMYRSDDVSLGWFAAGGEPRATVEAVEAGKKFTGDAHAEVWAKDPALVGRVRQFLGTNFHWHTQLAESGSNLDVISMLQHMVRSGSVRVIQQEPARGGSGAPRQEKTEASFWGADQYSHLFDASLADRYRAQLEAMNQDGSTLAGIRAMHDSINTQFMHAAVLADPLGTLPIFAQAGWVSKYGLPDLSGYGVDGASNIADQNFGEAGFLDSAAPYRLSDDVPLSETSSIRLAGRLTPNMGEPGTWYTNPGSGQMRLFGTGGNPVVDFDFDHDHGQGIPHTHNWDDLGGPYPVRGPGVGFSPLP